MAGELQDSEWLNARYVVEQLTLPQIAKLVGVTQSGVHHALVRHGIPRRRKGPVHIKHPKYLSAHCRIAVIRGKASTHTCECGHPTIHWAFRHDTPNDRFQLDDRNGPFSSDPNDYTPLCRKCHDLYDRNHRNDIELAARGLNPNKGGGLTEL